MAGAYPTIFYALDYCSVSTFHRQSRYGAKNISFSAVEAEIQIFFGVPERSSSSSLK